MVFYTQFALIRGFPWKKKVMGDMIYFPGSELPTSMTKICIFHVPALSPFYVLAQIPPTWVPYHPYTMKIEKDLTKILDQGVIDH